MMRFWQWIQSDGRAILAGKFEPNNVRRNLDGTLDSSFAKM